jgi:hypothetical protein
MTTTQIAIVCLVAPGWTLATPHGEPTNLFPEVRKDVPATLDWLESSWGIRPASTIIDGSALYVVPTNYRHCRVCGLHGADDGAWIDAPEHLNQRESGQPDPHGGICPGCQDEIA